MHNPEGYANFIFCTIRPSNPAALSRGPFHFINDYLYYVVIINITLFRINLL
jgi:hypothetical protein